MEFTAKHRQEIFKLSDGGQIALHYSENCPDFISEHQVPLEASRSLAFAQDFQTGEGSDTKNLDSEQRPLIVIIPGLMSTIDDHHIHNLITEAQSEGYDWVIFNYRGIHIPMTSGRPLTFDDYESFKEPLRHILE